MGSRLLFIFLISVRLIGRHGKVQESHQSQPKPQGSSQRHPPPKEVRLQADVIEGC